MLVCKFMHVCVSLSLSLPVSLCLSRCLSLSFFLSLSLSFSPSLLCSTHPAIPIPFPSRPPRSACERWRVSLCTCVCLSLYVSVSLSLCFSLSLSLSLPLCFVAPIQQFPCLFPESEKRERQTDRETETE